MFILVLIYVKSNHEKCIITNWLVKIRFSEVTSSLTEEGAIRIVNLVIRYVK